MLKDNLLKTANKIHFIGIGGISMSALAKLLLSQGKIVSGSDLKRSKITDTLKSLGVKVNIKHKAKAVDDSDLVVFTGAVDSANIEYQRAIELGIPIIERSQLLGFIASTYNTVIAIAGAHGKTTTTALLSKVLIDAGMNPTVHLGGEVDFLDGNVRVGGSNYFITEACEYRRSFLQLKPNYSIILNVEPEHLDTYGNYENVKKAFKEFVSNTEKLVVYNKNYIMDTQKEFVTFDIEKPSDIYVKNLRCKEGKYTFDAYYKDVFLHSFELGCIGVYNVLNALAVIAISHKLNINMSSVAKSIKEFNGVRRRFEKLGLYNNAEIILDYAHHPTEISCLIDAVRGYYDGELVVVFQPHTYSRTASSFDDFIKVLSRKDIDRVVLLPTYPAREQPKQGKTSMDIYKELRKESKSVKYLLTHNVTQFVYKLSLSKTMILFVGAGDIEILARHLF